jgi:K+-transporting ATPase ATPase C chain
MKGLFLKQFKTAIILLFLFTLLTGIIYPLLVTGIAQVFFPRAANGSLIQQGDKIIGSALIGQNFTEAKYFWGRPSATMPQPYDALHSSGSNFSVGNKNFLASVSERVKHLHEADPSNHQLIPVDLVTASGSGLDPHISVLSALYQVPRIAKARKLLVDEVNQLIQLIEEHSACNLRGEPRVNVLKLNIALDGMHHAKSS